MKVIVLTGEPFPNGMAATSRIKCYARALHSGGVDCEVVIIRPTELPGKVANIESKGVYEGISFRYVGGTTRRHRIKFLRPIVDIFSQLRTAFFLRKKLFSGDILFFYMEDVVIMRRFMKIAHRRGVRCIRDHCELAYGTGLETAKNRKYRQLTYKKQFPSLDGVISISDALLEIAKSNTLPSCKHIKVPILVDFYQYCLPNNANMMQVPYVFHAGTLSQQKDGILGMIEAFGIVSMRIGKPVCFISTGDLTSSKYKNEIDLLIKKYCLKDNIRFTGYLNDEEKKDYLSKASMVIINKYHTQQNDYCFSTKLGEYAAAAKPIIITRVGEAMNWFTDGKNAYVVEPEDVGALADAIEYVFMHPNESIEVGLSCQELCRKSFDFRNWIQPLVEFVTSL